MDLHDIAPTLIRNPAGYWQDTQTVEELSYPVGGNDFCLEIEDSSFWFAHRNDVIVAAVRRYPPGGPIFDVGAGNGYVAAALERAHFPTIAIEPNRAGAANAARRGLERVVHGRLPSSAFVEGAAGAIGLFDVVEHIADDAAFLLSLRPYLKRGGRVYVTTPAFDSLWSQNDTAAGHHRRYTRARLRALLEGAGFAVEYETYFFAFLPPPLFLFRVLPSRFRRSDAAVRERSRAQHRPASAAVRRAVERLLAPELGRIARGKSIPFGASCLAVARVR
ncbi:MAG TPA: class I SAM-dependent methyltransferase [Thermoanaerobaculia bacterium]|jgi:SAM-dependent methyltransferase